MTRSHDHVTWGAFAVIQGVEHEELFTLDKTGACLVEAGSTVNATGHVSGFAPPGDIHRVRNAGNRSAISIHIYGTDGSRIGSSARTTTTSPCCPPERPLEQTAEGGIAPPSGLVDVSRA